MFAIEQKIGFLAAWLTLWPCCAHWSDMCIYIKYYQKYSLSIFAVVQDIYPFQYFEIVSITKSCLTYWVSYYKFSLCFYVSFLNYIWKVKVRFTINIFGVIISDDGQTNSQSLSLSPLTLLEGPCFLCKTVSSTRCNTCRPDVWFCCNEHEALHRDPYMSTSSSKVFHF